MPAAEGKDVVHVPFDQGFRCESAADNFIHDMFS